MAAARAMHPGREYAVEIVEEALKRGNMTILDELVALACRIHLQGGSTTRTVERLKNDLARLRIAYPDRYLTLDSVRSDAERVRVNWIACATRQGE